VKQAQSESSKSHGASTVASGVIKASDTRFVPTLLRAIRVHQWTKNLLLGTALVAGHRFGDASAYFHLIIAFFSFSFAASAVYLINDLLDLQSDRKHPTKRLRPLACGMISIPVGIAVALICLAASIALSLWALPTPFQLWLFVYLFVASLYSFDLKRRLLLDVIALAGLYSIRILAGGAAVNVVVSRWLLAFSMFIFMSLAFAKRYVEAVGTNTDPGRKLAGRGYWSSDADLIRVVGPANGLMAVLVLTLYINSPDVRTLYNRPDVLWLLCPLLIYWVTRIWFLAHRGMLNEDPVLFALKDWRSYAVAAACALVMLAASL
jgi:4-hydroxybenzoate polyprenyltransferase